MRIAIISTFRHPSRLPVKEKTCMQSATPELIAGLCPEDAEIEIYNEKETDIPLDRFWDIVFFSYLHSFYEHTKVLSTIFRGAGMTTVAGGRHASLFVEDCLKYFDSVVVGDPEGNVPRLIRDFEHGCLGRIYDHPPVDPADIKPYRYDLIDFRVNKYRAPTIEASRGCPFACDFCVLVANEQYRFRPVKAVVRDIITQMHWNPNFMGLFRRTLVFNDNNLGGSPNYLRDLCEALIPLKKTWGCAITLNVLQDESLIRLMAKAGCRYVYSGVESLNQDTVDGLNKPHNQLKKLKNIIEKTSSNGILLSTGLIIGADGDTNEYLERIPDLLSGLNFFGITFLGIVCPYPGTALYRRLLREGRIIQGTTIRDFDGYTVCHKPTNMDPSELAEHYRKLTISLSSMPNLLRHWSTALLKSRLPRYKSVVLVSGLEMRKLRNNLINETRTYVAGRDPIEQWDLDQMQELGIPPQQISPSGHLLRQRL